MKRFKDWLVVREGGGLMGDIPDQVNDPKKGIPGYPGVLGGMGGPPKGQAAAPAAPPKKMKSKMKK